MVDHQRIHLPGHCNSPEGEVHRMVDIPRILHIPAVGDLGMDGHRMGSGCRSDQGEDDRAGLRSLGA